MRFVLFGALALLSSPASALDVESTGPSSVASQAISPSTVTATQCMRSDSTGNSFKLGRGCGDGNVETFVDNVTVISTLTVQGTDFNVGRSTFAVSGGLVGVGMVVPSKTFVVKPSTNVSSLMLEQTNSPDGWSFWPDSSDGKLAISREGNAGVRNALVILQSSGNVGISTNTPQTLLDVNGAASFGSGGTKSTFSAAGNLAFPAGGGITSQLTFVGTASTVTVQGAMSVGGGLASGATQFFVQGATFTVLNTGFVGIGVSSPTSRLQVSGPTDLQGPVTIEGSSLTANGTARFVSGSPNTQGDTINEYFMQGANSIPTSSVGLLTLQSNNAQGAYLGGSIALGARYQGDTAAANFAEIHGGKENSTSGNLNGFLRAYVRSNASGQLKAIDINSEGTVNMGFGAVVVGSTTLQGVFLPFSRTKAQIDAMTPGTVGEFVFCSNCNNLKTVGGGALCQSTATTIAAYQLNFSSGGVNLNGCGSGN